MPLLSNGVLIRDPSTGPQPEKRKGVIRQTIGFVTSALQNVSVQDPELEYTPMEEPSAHILASLEQAPESILFTGIAAGPTGAVKEIGVLYQRTYVMSIAEDMESMGTFTQEQVNNNRMRLRANANFQDMSTIDVHRLAAILDPHSSCCTLMNDTLVGIQDTLHQCNLALDRMQTRVMHHLLTHTGADLVSTAGRFAPSMIAGIATGVGAGLAKGIEAAVFLTELQNCGLEMGEILRRQNEKTLDASRRNGNQNWVKLMLVAQPVRLTEEQAVALQKKFFYDANNLFASKATKKDIDAMVASKLQALQYVNPIKNKDLVLHLPLNPEEIDGFDPYSPDHNRQVKKEAPGAQHEEGFNPLEILDILSGEGRKKLFAKYGILHNLRGALGREEGAQSVVGQYRAKMQYSGIDKDANFLMRYSIVFLHGNVEQVTQIIRKQKNKYTLQLQANHKLKQGEIPAFIIPEERTLAFIPPVDTTWQPGLDPAIIAAPNLVQATHEP